MTTYAASGMAVGPDADAAQTRHGMKIVCMRQRATMPTAAGWRWAMAFFLSVDVRVHYWPFRNRAGRPRSDSRRYRGQVLQKIDEPAFGAGIAVDVGLGMLDRTVAGKLLHVAQAAARPEDQPCGACDEGAPAGMR
jgi:hypothetical protein